MSIRDSIKDSTKNIASDIARMIQSRADTNLSNLSEKAEEVLDGKFVAQNMYETGAVLTDTWGYNQLVEMVSSTDAQTGTDTVTINDEEVEIPYTLSSTGSKIVDVAYRDKVQALYEQEGKALYYTLDTDNQNFTLPMGEIYGMITDTYTKTELDTALDEVMGKLELFAEELGVETNTDEAEE